MTITVEAVYENGILRPIQPIALAEGTHVEVIVVSEQDKVELTPAEALAQIAAMPSEGSHPPFSGRDHDSLLYTQKGSQ